MQPTKTSAVEAATSISEGSTVNNSSDEPLEDEDYAFPSEEAQSIIRKWSADQLAIASHVEGILIV